MYVFLELMHNFIIGTCVCVYVDDTDEDNCILLEKFVVNNLSYDCFSVVEAYQSIIPRKLRQNVIIEREKCGSFP